MPEAVLLSAARTPIGRMGGALQPLTAPELGAIALREALARARVLPSAVDEVLLGQVLQAGVGQAPARQASLRAGIEASVPCTTINKVCGSGLKAVMLAAQAVRAGDAEIVLAGGMESMSSAPYLLDRARSGYRMGHGVVRDAMILDGLWDPFEAVHMGTFGDLFAKEEGYSRSAQDEYAHESYRRALHAQREGAFSPEIVPVEIGGKKPLVVSEDEEPSRYQPEKLGELPPAFSRDGTVTAANASKLNDGAAAVVVASEAAARRLEMSVLARISASATYAGEARRFPLAPAHAIERAARAAGLAPKDIDLFEISEAFAVVPLAVTRALGLDPARVNVHGGAISLGHPIGCSGARLLVTLLSAMESRGARTGCATLCLGGGEAVAVVVSRDGGTSGSGAKG